MQAKEAARLEHAKADGELGWKRAKELQAATLAKGPEGLVEAAARVLGV